MKGKQIPFSRQPVVYRQIAVMLESGVSLNQTLTIQIRMEEDQTVKKILIQAQKLLQNGIPVRQAFEKSGLVVHPLFIQLIEIGEHSGRLGPAFDHIARTVEESREFRSKVFQALSYPAVILTVAAVSVLIMIFFIVPSFAEAYTSMAVDLPFMTVALLQIQQFLSAWGVYLLAAVAGAVWLFIRFGQQPAIRPKLESWLFSLPFLGDFWKMKINYEFCVGLSLLLGDGVPLLKSITLIGKNTGSILFSRQISGFISGLESGKRLSGLMDSTSIVSPVVQQMILVGEETSELPRLLNRAAGLIKNDLDTRLKVMVSLLEPILIVVLGLVVGILLISMYLPLFDSMSQIGGK
ncbi:MAG: type II secretion system F family protein [Bacteroidetes bacterium]|nr:type II secretion system F family protein [Bacteroidota bacterium]